MPEPRRIRMSRPDRLVRGHITANAIGPLDLPSRDALVDALVTIASIGPNTRVGLQFGADGKSWWYDEANLRSWCESMVLSADPISADTLAGDLGRFADDMDLNQPLALVIAGDYLVQLYEHGLGDGLLMLGLPGAVLQVAGGSPVPEWLAVPSSGNPVASAILQTFVRHPGRAVSLLRARSGRGVVSAQAREIAWTPEYAIAFARGDAGANRAIRDWSKVTAVSFTAALTALLALSFEANGIAMTDAATLVVDVRRYLPAGVLPTGNFITGVPLQGVAVSDPVAVESRMNGALLSGRPAASLAAGTIKHVLGVGGHKLSATRPAAGAAHLVMSNMGVSAALADLPWRGAPGEGQVLFTNRPTGATEIGVLAAIVGGHLHITATFHANVFDADAVNEALTRVTQASPSLLV